VQHFVRKRYCISSGSLNNFKLLFVKSIKIVSRICSFTLFLLVGINSYAQPDPCGPIPIMTNDCAESGVFEACVICDIDGFTGTNNLEDNGQSPPGFCSFPDDMHWIAFIAGSTSLSIQIDVSNCTLTNLGEQSLDLGFYESLDCINFSQITQCRMDLENGESFVFNTIVPLTIGQHYYLVMDGSSGSICDWTFTVIDGTTAVDPLTNSGNITHIPETCPDLETTFFTELNEPGAAIFFWTIDGVEQAPNTQLVNITFPADGSYEVCVSAANACDEAPPVCSTIKVRTPGTTNIVEDLCDGECIESNGIQFCQTGVFQEIITLQNGCDSIINLDLTVLPQASEEVDLWICNDDFFFIGQTPYNLTGVYQDTVLTSDECDSIVYLDLLVIECEIIGSPEQIPVICNGTSTGTLIFSVDQGEVPLSFTWTSILDPTLTGSGTTNLLVDNQIPNIPAGTYQIYITDDFGNDVVVLQEVTEPPVLEATLIPSDYNGFNVSCFMDNGLPGSDGTLDARVEGGVPPYFYAWSDGQNTPVATNLTYDTYTVTVTDDVGCTLERMFTLDSAPPVMANVAFNNPTCDGFDTGTIDVQSVSGGTPSYAFSLSNGNFSSDTIFNDLFEGDYTVYIQDGNGCVYLEEGNLIAPEIPVIDFPEDLTIDLCDSIALDPIFNDAILKTIQWTPSDFITCDTCLVTYATPVNSIEYVLSVISINDCTDTDSIQVFVNERRRVYVPNIFSPNGDGLNEELIFNGGCEVDFVIAFDIFDRWGNLVFHQEDFPANDPDYAWDGRFKEEKLIDGLFSWVAEVSFIDGATTMLSGNITIVR